MHLKPEENPEETDNRKVSSQHLIVLLAHTFVVTPELLSTNMVTEGTLIKFYERECFQKRKLKAD